MIDGREMRGLTDFAVGLAVLVLLVFGILNWLDVPSGRFIDWMIGLASFWWLLVIVTVPWNIYFSAKQVLDDAKISQKQNLKIQTDQLHYVRKVARRSLWIAISLHLLSTIGLYGLAVAGISQIGYISSVATLLFTGLRPAIVFYQYLAQQLQAINREFKYPRDDVLKSLQQLETLKDELKMLTDRVEALEHNLDDTYPDSWAAQQNAYARTLDQVLTDLSTEHRQLVVQNQTEHRQLRAEARDAIAQLSEDGQFLEHVREIIRFVKTA